MVLVGSTLISPDEIGEYVLENDINNHFKSAHYHWDNYIKHWTRLKEANQIMFLLDEGGTRVEGMCSWAIVSEEGVKGINKVSWELPEVIQSGDILYVDICVLQKRGTIYLIKKKFNEMGYRSFIKEVLWFNMPGGHLYRQKIYKEA